MKEHEGPRPVVNAELLDVRAVAALLGGCSVRHIYRLVDGGRMPRPLKLRSLLRWRRAELDPKQAYSFDVDAVRSSWAESAQSLRPGR